MPSKTLLLIRRFAVIVAALVVLGAGSSVVQAGWPSADRMDDQGESIAPCDRGMASECEPPERGDERHWRDDQLIQDGRQLAPMRQVPSAGGIQPYWGTMRPYWGSNERPGVIHRGARTEGFKKSR